MKGVPKFLPSGCIAEEIDRYPSNFRERQNKFPGCTVSVLLLLTKAFFQN
jgi:hypothetical protein